jgi:predicted nucleotidyltransferase
MKRIHDSEGEIVSTKLEVLKKLDENEKGIKEFGVSRFGLAGAWANGDPNPSGNVEVFVELEMACLDHCVDLKDYLEKILCRRVNLLVTETSMHH